MNKNHGLAIMRCQPFHLGHARIVDRMLKECSLATILIGSIQESCTDKNPLKYKFRKRMIKNVYGGNPGLKIFGIYDIKDNDEWADYVLDFLDDCLNHPDISHYYAGCPEDAAFFTGKIKNIAIVDRNDGSCLVSGSEIRRLIRAGDPMWRDGIHQQNHALIMENSNAFKPA